MAEDEKAQTADSQETYVASQAFLSQSRIDYINVGTTEDIVLEVQIFNYNLLPSTKNPDTSGKKPLLFIHGYMDSRYSFLRTIELLDINDRLIIVPSLRGFGDSQIYPNSPDDNSLFTLNQFADDLIKVLGHYKISSAIWIGHSLGSMISHFAASSDNLDGLCAPYVSSAVLIGTRPSVPKEIGEFVWKDLEPMVSVDTAFIKGFQETDELTKNYSKELSYQVQRESFKTRIQPLKQTWYNLIGWDGSSYLSNVNQNITVIWGTKDEIADKSAQDEFMKLVSNATFIEIDGKGHNTQWQAPKQTADIIKDHIAKNDN